MASVLPQPAMKEDAAQPGMATSPGHWREALDTCENLELLQPDDAAVVFYKGRAQRELGRADDAIATFHRALELDPNMVSAHDQLGMIHRDHGDYPAALHHLERAAELNPVDPRAHLALGGLHREQGDLDTAVIHWRRALDIDALFTPALHCLGVAMDHQDSLDEALEYHRRVAQQAPSLSENHRYLAMIQTDLGHLDDALASTGRALELAPDSAEARWQRFFIRALRGDFPDAWDDYECRFHLQNRTTPQREFSQPRWRGEPLAGRTLLVHAEQGLGDTLHMARYLGFIARQGGRVLLWCPSTLVPLLQNLSGVDQVFADLDPHTSFDCHLPLMSLPGVLQATPDNPQTSKPYLTHPNPEVFPLPSATAGALRVGLAWDGSHSQPIDRRSVPLAALEPLLDLPGIAFYSLQVGSAAQALRDRGWDKKIIDLSPRLTDLSATAATAMQLDLVISLDSAVAHLGGALGQPTWVMLSATPDWRWGRSGDRTQWYPSARLFRQAKAGEWTPVIADIVAALRRESLVETNHDAKTQLLLDLNELNGRPQETLPLIKAYLKQHPQTADIWNLLGSTLSDLGQDEDALAAFAAALKLQPHYPEALYNQGNTHYKAGQHEAARGAWKEALRQNPQTALAHYNLGLLAQEQGQPAEAADRYRHELQLDPSHLDAGLNLGEALREAGRLDEAIAHLQQFRTRNPKHPEAAINLSAMLTQAHRLEEAAETCKTAMVLAPQSPRAWSNRGALLHRQGEYTASRESCEKALALDPQHADARYNLSLHQLLHGDYKNGFKNYSSRWRTDNPIFTKRLPFPLPLWDGKPLGNQPLLVLSEQGQGDVIQFARLLPLLAQQGIRVVLQCPTSLRRLLEPMAAVERVVPKDSVPTDCVACCPLMDLPNVLKLKLDNLPPADYLPAPLPSELPGECLRVGLAWAGNPEHSLDHERTLHEPTVLKPLLDTSGVQFYSLQIDRPPFDRQVADLRDQLKDFDDTASVVAALDLVISVDTAVAHLAGTLGVPTWVLLPSQPDWRWLLDRMDSPWYPGLKLFRQQQAGNWTEVLGRLTPALARFKAR